MLWRNRPEMNNIKRLQKFETARSKRFLDHSKNQLRLLTGDWRLRKIMMSMEPKKAVP